MGTSITRWHVLLTALMTERAPPGVEVRPEVLLSVESQRADLLLLRRAGAPRQDDQARVLRGLWPRLPLDTILEFKSLGRPFRRGGLVRLLGYGCQHYVAQLQRMVTTADLALALLLPSIIPALERELDELRLTLSPLGEGYYKADGSPFSIYVAVADEVAVAERDTLLGFLGHHKSITLEDQRWLEERLVTRSSKDRAMEDMEGHDEALAKFLASLPVQKRVLGLEPEEILAAVTPEQRLAGIAPEQRLAGIAPEQRLAGIAPEQRLADLAPAQQILALSDETLRTLPNEYIRTLPPDVQDKIRNRLNH